MWVNRNCCCLCYKFIPSSFRRWLQSVYLFVDVNCKLPVVIIRSTCYNIRTKLCILPPQCISVLLTVLRVISVMDQADICLWQRRLGFSPMLSATDFWWVKWYWDTFLYEYFGLPLSALFYQWFILIHSSVISAIQSISTIHGQTSRVSS
jgi:hypothetical protein